MLHKFRIIGLIAGISLILSLPLSAQDLQTALKLTLSEQFETAGKTFQTLITNEPTKGDNYYYYGEYWLKKFFVDSMTVSLKEVIVPALQNFNKGVEKDPLNPLNYVGLGRVNILQGKYSEAKTNFEKAISLLPIKNYKKSDISLTNQALTFAKMAEARLKAPDKTLPELIALIDKAVERSNIVPEVYLIKGDIYLEFNDGSSAIVAYNRANELDPKSCKAKVKIGQLWVRGKNYTDAIIYYNEAIAIDASFAPAYRERAELYGLAGKWDNGIKDYQKFLELSEKNTYAKVRYASFLFMAKKYQEAIQIINEVMAVDPTYNVLCRLSAYSYYEIDKCSNALKSIELFFDNVKKNDTKVIASDYTYYGDILSKLGFDSLAVEKYKLGYELEKTNCDILTKIAKTSNKLKKYTDVIESYSKKIKNDCATLTDYYDLGKAYYSNGGQYMEKGDTVTAISQWNKADSTLTELLTKKADFINAVYYRAMSRASIDYNSEKGLALSDYENLLSLSLADSVKYKSFVNMSYEYMRYFYYKQYNMNKNCDDARKSIIYCDKILASDPKNENSLLIKKSLAGKCPK